MKRFLQLSAALLVVAVGAVMAQNLPTITVQSRLSASITAASVTNATATLATAASQPYKVRAWVYIENTNETVDVNLYSSATPHATNLVKVLKAGGGNWSVSWPVIDNGSYYVQSTATGTVTVVVSEAWGQ